MLVCMDGADCKRVVRFIARKAGAVGIPSKQTI
jgi:hypothetical protein